MHARAFVLSALAAFACLTALPSGAGAENLFTILFEPRPLPQKSNPWAATVMRAPEAAVPEARGLNVPEARDLNVPEARAIGPPARDPAWTATVVALNTASLTTGSLAHAAYHPAAPGPRLTGKGHALSGVASFYGEDQMTATGEHFNKRAMTAAHKTLPFGTRVRVTRTDTGKAVVVRINDRGPYVPGRIIDLSEVAAETLGMMDTGTTPVKLEVLGQ